MMDWALLVIFPSLMAYAAASDLVSMTIPNRVSLLLVAFFLVFAGLSGLGWAAIGWHALAGLVVLAVAFGMFAMGWIGGGDAKLAAATSLWLGFEIMPQYLVHASLLGGLLTFAVLILRGRPMPSFTLSWVTVQRLSGKEAGIPYGIALAAAALLVYPHSPIWLALAGH